MSEKTAMVESPEYWERFKEYFENIEQPFRVALFTHPAPDPDAIGSIIAMEWLLKKAYGIDADGFYVTQPAHPQNVSMTNLLEPNMRPISEYNSEEYSLSILLDATPSHAGIGENDVVFDIVIDHHRETCGKEFEGLFIHLKAGSCCATVYDLIKNLGLEFGKEDATVKKDGGVVPTALLIGISTDTENMMSDDSTEYEFEAWGKLFEFRNPSLMKRIINFDRPKFWIDNKAIATQRVTLDEGVAVVGMGNIPGRHRDVIAEMAQEMVSWEDVHTAIVFALVEGNRIEGSIRSMNSSVSVPQLAKDLGGENGFGGGKLGKGAYAYELGGGAVSADDDAEIKEKTWELFDSRENKRIARILKK
jgi:nanoRNase/pAp phosphatase (c-di-AMP/oligoRNAs hydrolase)